MWPDSRKIVLLRGGRNTRGEAEGSEGRADSLLDKIRKYAKKSAEGRRTAKNEIQAIPKEMGVTKKNSV